VTPFTLRLEHDLMTELLELAYESLGSLLV
jgi:hypothetical protein